MMRLPILALLSSAVLLCGAAPALEPVTFTDNNSTAAARLAMHHINEHHNHGYKFQLSETQGYKAEKVDEVKLIELQLNLLETRCHVVNPKHFEDCETRSEGERAVKANCTVMMTVKNGDAKVTKYECDTRQAKTNFEMAMICPDCPVLLALNTSEGLQSANEAVRKINQNTTNKHYYILQEVGRIQAGYIPMKGMYYYVEFAIVETHCPMGSRIVPEACKPLCPERAHHALCQSTYSRDEGLVAFESLVSRNLYVGTFIMGAIIVLMDPLSVWVIMGILPMPAMNAPQPIPAREDPHPMFKSTIPILAMEDHTTMLEAKEPHLVKKGHTPLNHFIPATDS
uniref:alpha-2-HS-glycoprotein 1 n=1 Tax=Monopterus albus TaxID=43700 RepID=UPI0009B4B6F4|nr:antihemorrhagic factor cHLP-B-like [Monopterus albus]